jgi:hypothetical protein
MGPVTDGPGTSFQQHAYGLEGMARTQRIELALLEGSVFTE